MAKSSCYRIVDNHQERYSTWRADRPPPEGWRAAGRKGAREECLSGIEAIWKDVRPLSVRQAAARATER